VSGSISLSDGFCQQNRIRHVERALFNSFFMAGFECSTHRLPSGKRLDMLAATGHDRFLERDYQRLHPFGIKTVREGLRWHLIEPRAGYYDWSSLLPTLRAAQTHDLQVIWDICHYGYPDDIDPFTPKFVRRFTALARAFVDLLESEGQTAPLLVPINEISFFSWAGADAAFMNPCEHGRGFELKVQLVRAVIEGIEAIWDVLPQARIIHTDPVIHILPRLDQPQDAAEAEGYRRAQFQGWDLLSGRIWPQIGGHIRYLDIVGVNYYPNNQWYYRGDAIPLWDANYRPFHDILRDVYTRYQRPMFVAETGAEGGARGTWLRYVCEQVAVAREIGIPLEGICLYPMVSFPGWDDERDCQNGLWGYADDAGERPLCDDMAMELQVQQCLHSERTGVANIPHLAHTYPS
jgi:hypothetical protein